MVEDWLQLAVANNADWCRSIARSQGLSYRDTSSVWYSSEKMPPFYPNLVTLEPTNDTPKEIEILEESLRTEWGVKDSFSSLKLDERGFSVLLGAEWYIREPAEWNAQTTGVESVQLVKTERQLSAWVDAWGETTAGSTVFGGKLLEDESVELLYVESGGKVVAGIACNLSEVVVGISNAFGAPSSISACIGRCAEANPSRALVGYGSSAELRGLDRLGFRSLGPLRIWLKN